MSNSGENKFDKGHIKYPSLDALRKKHVELISKRRQEGESSTFQTSVIAFINDGRLLGKLLAEEEERSSAQSILDYWTNYLLRLNIELDSEDTVLDDFDPSLAPKIPDELCPYRGLEPFGPEDHQYFYGRSRAVESILEKLQHNHFVVVMGASGSGKSSVVLAGVLPAMQHGAIHDAISDSGEWRFFSAIVPGAHPLENLVRYILYPHGIGLESIKREIDLLKKDSKRLVKLINVANTVPTVLIIDQFEEVFTLCWDQEEREAFVANLLALAEDADASHSVILTVRTDFESNLARLPQLKERLDKVQINLMALSASELREAIEAPAKRIGLKFESGLIDRLVEDVLGEPAALPLLQFTLLKLWENRERNRITWRTYEKLGGALNALGQSADQLYQRMLPEEQLTLRRILLQLVKPTDGLEVTSNRISLARIYQIGEAKDRIDRVLDRLADEHLIRITQRDTPEETQIEVAHEALIRNWPLLGRWIAEARDSLRKRRRLTTAAEQWDSLGRIDDALWRGSLIEEASKYDDLSILENEFLEASLAAQKKEQQQQEFERTREIEQAKALAKEREITARRFKRLAKILAVMIFIALIASIFSVYFAIKTREQKNAAIVAQQTAEAGATEVVRNLEIAENSLAGQVGYIDQIATVEADRAFLRLTLTAITAATPIPTQIQSHLTATKPLQNVTPIPTGTLDSSHENLAATATIVALATQRAKIKATQVAIMTPTMMSADIQKIYQEGELAYNQNDWQGVIDLMDIVINNTSDNVSEKAEAYNYRGWANYELGKFDEALADFTSAIELNPQFARAYHNRGMTYDELGKDRLAIIDFTKAIQLSHDPIIWSYSARAWAYYRTKQYQNALNDTRHCLRLDPKYSYCYLTQGHTYYALGDIENARKAYEKCYEYDPNSFSGKVCKRQLDQLGN